MPVQTRAYDCECGERMLATNDQTLGKAIKDHLGEKHERRDTDLEEAVGVARSKGFDPQEDGAWTLRSPARKSAVGPRRVTALLKARLASPVTVGCAVFG